ncbi:MAG: hypothetical protein HQK92_13500 [Nitrospirae bacterium]|nr:hypothetical protein [Nitrospirota bacterium]
MAQDIVSGDRVVDLAASLKGAALFAGAASCAVALWIIKRSVVWSVAAIVVGGIAGLCIGFALSPSLFPAPSGQVVVVKFGPGAWASLMKATLTGAVVSGIVIAAVPAWLFAKSTRLMMLVGIGGSIGAVIGVAFSYVNYLYLK